MSLKHFKPTWKAGWRVIGSERKFYRSRWEANYARYLEWLREKKQIQSWRHEPETFWFPGIKRGVCSYLPDFEVTRLDLQIEFHEVKGHFDAKSKTKLKRMIKYYPNTKVVVIGGSVYKSIERAVSKMIPHWEE